METLGIDVGGSGIKGAPVDVPTGTLVTPRIRILTPQPSTPDAVAGVVVRLLEDADWSGPVGATFPAVIQTGSTSSSDTTSSAATTNAQDPSASGALSSSRSGVASGAEPRTSCSSISSSGASLGLPCAARRAATTARAASSGVCPELA